MFSNDATPLSGGDLFLGKLGLRFTCPSTWKRCVCGLTGPLEAMGNSRDAADGSTVYTMCGKAWPRMCPVHCEGGYQVSGHYWEIVRPGSSVANLHLKRICYCIKG